MLCGWGVKTGMACVGGTGRYNSVIPWLTGAISEHLRDEVIYNNALYKWTLLYYFTLNHFDGVL